MSIPNSIETQSTLSFLFVPRLLCQAMQTLLTRKEPDTLTTKVKVFLVGKGEYDFQDHTYIILYGFEGKPYLLTPFIYDRFILVEVCRQYKK
jgi:hypothetical protein